MPPSIRPACRTLYSSARPSIRRSLPSCSRLQSDATKPSDPSTGSTSSQSPYDGMEALSALTSPKARRPFGRSSYQELPASKLLENIAPTAFKSAHTSTPNGSALEASAQAHRMVAKQGLERSQKENLAKKRAARIWKVGDVYSPRDLGPVEQRNWTNRYHDSNRKTDVFKAIGKSPLAFYRNFTVLSEFTNETGQILHRKFTGLTGHNQRKMAKTIRRSIGLGLIPSVHDHPMLRIKSMFSSPPSRTYRR